MTSVLRSDNDDSDYVPSDDDFKVTEFEVSNVAELVCNKQLTLSKSGKSKSDEECIFIKSPEIYPIKQKRPEDVWKNFMNDIKSSSVAKNEIDVAAANVKVNPKPNISRNVLTEIYDYAGEAVTMFKSVDGSSAQFQQNQTPVLKIPGIKMTDVITNKNTSTGANSRLKLDKDLNSVIGNISKKRKMSTLQKSLYDWDAFKRSEGIEDDLKKYNKGKGGYLERQAFLQRTNVREFELEKKVKISKIK